MKKHAFIVGGTGMLMEASAWIAAQGWHISIVARNKTRMQTLIDQTKHVTPITIDYHNFEQFRKEIKKTIQKNGKITLVLAWAHTSAQKILHIIDEEIQNPYKMFHVLGTKMQKVKLTAKCNYKTIKLGKKGNRWLTNKEISKIIIETIKENKKK